MAIKIGMQLLRIVKERLLSIKKKNAEIFSSAIVKLRHAKFNWLLAAIVLTFMLFSFGIIAGSRVNVAIIGSGGNIKVEGVGVYSDRNCAVPLTYLNWGALEPGSNENITLYVRNEGNNAATLSLVTANWSPVSTSNYLTLNWNYNGQILNPMESIEIVLNLSVSSAIENISNFNFDVVIGAN